MGNPGSPDPELTDPFESRVIELLVKQERHQERIANLLVAMLTITILALLIVGIVALAGQGPS